MANKIKGLTIEIGGDTTLLQKSMSEVNKKTRDLKSELRDVERLLKLDPGNTELVAQKQKILAESVETTSEKLNQLKEAEKQVQEQFENGEVSEEQVRALQREVTKTENELKKLKDASSDFGKSFSKDLQEAGKSMQEFGGKIEGAGKKMVPLSAAAGGALAGIVGLGVKAAQSADDINTLAKQTGLSTDQIQKFQYASELIDVPLETLTGSMSKLTKNMGMAKEGTGAASDAFKELGVDVRDSLTGELRNNQDVFDETITKLAELENSTERDSIAMEIFGKSAQDLNPLILGGAEALTQLGKEAEDAGLILSEDALNSANEFNDAMDTLKAKTAGKFAAVGTEIAVTLTPMLESVADKIGIVVDWFGALDEGTLKIIMTVLALVAGLAPLLIIIGKVISAVGVITSALPTLGTAFAVLTGPIGIIVGAIVGFIAIIVTLYKNNEEFRDKIIELWEKIKLFFFETFESIKQIVTSVLEAVKKFWEEHSEEIKETVTKMFKSLQEVFTKYLEFIKKLITTFIEAIKKFWEIFGDDIIKVTEALWKTLEKVFSSAMDIISGLLDIFIGLFSGDWERMKEGAIDVFNGLWEGVKGIVEGAWDILKLAFSVLWDNISGWFEDLKDSAVDWGKNLINGFVDGIKSKIQAVKDVMKSVVGVVSDFIGFNSPSKKGEGRNIVKWGSNMVKGFVEGMEDAMPKLEQSINKLIPKSDISNTSNVNNAKVSLKFYPQKMTESELEKTFNYCNRRFGLDL